MLQVGDVAAASGWYQRTLGLTSGHGGDEFEMRDLDGYVVAVHTPHAHQSDD